jgi:hypothetical protein
MKRNSSHKFTKRKRFHLSGMVGTERGAPALHLVNRAQNLIMMIEKGNEDL